MTQDITYTVPGSVAIDLRVIPMRELGDTLVLATDTRPTTEKESRLVFILNRAVRFVIRSPDWIDAMLEALYRTSCSRLENPAESQDILWYWPAWHSMDGDKLVVKVSGWEGMTHWTGAESFPMDHPDREFWEWLLQINYYTKGLLDDQEIPKIKRVWRRYTQRTNAAANDRK